MIMTRY